jgi:hypothetical protein
MHKSILLAVVVASLLIASPLTMLGISAEQSTEQNQYSVTQIADSTIQQKIKQLPTITQQKMQQQQLEKLQQQLSMGVQNQENELQMMEEDPSQQESNQLSIITQEKMQQQQFDKFKNSLKSVRDKQITVTQE